MGMCDVVGSWWQIGCVNFGFMTETLIGQLATYVAGCTITTWTLSVYHNHKRYPQSKHLCVCTGASTRVELYRPPHAEATPHFLSVVTA